MTTPTTADFLRFRFRHNGPDDRIELRPFTQDGLPGLRSWHLDPTAAADAAATLPRSHNVFYGVTARLNEGGKKEHITSCPGVWQDLDFGRYADGEAGAWAALDAFPLAPTTVTHTGGGLQATWEFVAPLTNRQQFPAFEDLLSRHAGLLGSDPSVAETARVMRLPGSHNNKKKYGTPRPVTIVRFNPERLYTVADFERVLPAPEAQERPQAPYPRGTHRTGDVPTVDELAEMLRHIDPQPGYKDWLTILAAIHSAYPGPDGEALCEAWSGHVSKPGEIAEKFKSFGNYQGTRGNATIGTVIYAAKLGGYRPPQATYHPGQSPDAAGYVAQDCGRCAQLAADVQRLGDQLRARDGRIVELEERHRRDDEEQARLVGRVTELETENAALEAAIRHPVQAAGIGALDQVEAAQRAYQRGEVVTLGGEDFARVPATTAAKRRSAKTLTTGLKALIGLTPSDPLPREPVAFGRDRAFAVFARSERIETPTFKGEVDIPYIFIPEALRGQRGKAVLGILPTCAGEKRHGGRRTIPVPPEVAAQPDPVRRKREHVTRWYSALTDAALATQTEHLGTDYWTAQGEALTFEQITQQRVAEGYEPPRVPAYRPTQPPLRLHRAEPRHLAEVSHSMAEPRQLADSLTTGTCRQVAEVSAPPTAEPRHLAEVFAPPTVEPGHCPDCGAKATIGGHCAQHFNGHLEHHRATWAYAQVGD